MKVNIYLNKDLQSKLDEVSKEVGIPTPTLIRLMLNEPIFTQALDQLIVYKSQLKEIIQNDQK